MPSPVAERPARRTQEQRTAQTRAALLDATVACLVEVGFARTTTTAVAQRAGVSLGALVHHFPAKSELLAAAVGHLSDLRVRELRAAAAAVDPGADRLEVLVDLLWRSVSGPSSVAWTELWVVARTDPELAPAVLARTEAFAVDCRATLDALLPAAGHPGPVVDEAGLSFAFAVLEGTALRGLLRPPGAAQDETPVALLAALATRLVRRSPDTAP